MKGGRVGGSRTSGGLTGGSTTLWRRTASPGQSASVSTSGTVTPAGKEPLAVTLSNSSVRPRAGVVVTMH